MEFTKPLENLIAASYLSGAGEAFKKSKELTGDAIDKHIDDIKPLRRTFLNRAESDGYEKPVHHIEEAKKLAADTLKGITPPANLSFAESLFGKADSSLEEPTVEKEPVKSSGIVDTINKMAESINIFKSSIPQPASAQINSLHSTFNTAHMNSPPTTVLPHMNSPPTTELPHMNSPPTTELPHMNSPPTTELPHMNSPPTTELPHINVGMLPKTETAPLLQLGGKKRRHTKKRTNRKKKTLRK